jgi:hypothetical protein
MAQVNIHGESYGGGDHRAGGPDNARRMRNEIKPGAHCIVNARSGLGRYGDGDGDGKS